MYAASAAMEWAGDRNEKVPVNIFELGLKLFLSLPAYVLAYVDFLVGTIPLFLYAPSPVALLASMCPRLPR